MNESKIEDDNQDALWPPVVDLLNSLAAAISQGPLLPDDAEQFADRCSDLHTRFN